MVDMAIYGSEKKRVQVQIDFSPSSHVQLTNSGTDGRLIRQQTALSQSLIDWENKINERQCCHSSLWLVAKLEENRSYLISAGVWADAEEKTKDNKL